ncbi:MAG: peptidylprolyl isomerase [Rhodovibrionaceae bacterium]|nr:peptidylprolyl isomerase [Rhodovibrionaceae bacterium]
MSESTPASAEPKPENVLIMETSKGTVKIEMLPDLAPNHVERIRELTRQGFYDGVVFHRVIDGFMAQTGDPTGTGRGGSGQNLDAEFSRAPFERGSVGMARAQNPDSADSQFFIMFASAPHLNGQYTLWGQVIDGMDVVDSLKKASQNSSGGMVRDPDKIETMKVQADLKD